MAEARDGNVLQWASQPLQHLRQCTGTSVTAVHGSSLGSTRVLETLGGWFLESLGSGSNVQKAKGLIALLELLELSILALY